MAFNNVYSKSVGKHSTVFVNDKGTIGITLSDGASPRTVWIDAHTLALLLRDGDEVLAEVSRVETNARRLKSAFKARERQIKDAEKARIMAEVKAGMKSAYAEFNAKLAEANLEVAIQDIADDESDAA